MIGASFRLYLALVLASAATAATVAIAEPVSAQTEARLATTEERIRTAVTPILDLAGLVQKVNGARMSTSDESPVAGREPGLSEEFWLMDGIRDTYFKVRATLWLATDNAYWYVQEGETVDLAALGRAAERFERHIYPAVRQYLGAERPVGANGDPRIAVLNARIPGVGGYYSLVDEYPREVHPYSNQRKVLYVSLGSGRFRQPEYDITLAHELAHMVQWYANGHQETWVDEGVAELVSTVVAGAGRRSTSSFEANPGVQLTAWSKDASRAASHYEGAFLFMAYFADHYSGLEGLGQLLATQGRGAEAFNRFLRQAGTDTDFDRVFVDWTVANLVDDLSVADGRFGYRSVHPRLRSLGRVLVDGGPAAMLSAQYSGQYLEIIGAADAVEVEFQGQSDVRLVSTDPFSGSHVWWSNRGDSLDARLTRELDLTSVDRATLRFRTWYDIEKDFDYLYVMVSADGGSTWQLLGGPAATAENPTGNSLGLGYTGSSGGQTRPRWIEESIDLTPFAGHRILVRFEYVTDQSFSSSGTLLDDIEVPEIGYFDDVETDEGWLAEGFVWSDNIVSQRFGVRLVQYRADGIQVLEVPLDSYQRGTIRIQGLGSEVQRAVLVVAPYALATTEPAKFSVEARSINLGSRTEWGDHPSRAVAPMGAVGL